MRVFLFHLNSNLIFNQQDHIYDQDSTTQELYDDVARPIVEKSVKGFNGTIFAYGQTSSGKNSNIICNNLIRFLPNIVFFFLERHRQDLHNVG